MATTKRRPTNKARQALAAHRRALAQLIELLRDPDEEVRQEAADAKNHKDLPVGFYLASGVLEAGDPQRGRES